MIVTRFISFKSTPTLLLVACLWAPATVDAIEALQNVDPPLNAIAVIDDEVGFVFLPTTNITIEALGFSFEAQQLPSSYVVKVLNHAGEVLVSTTLLASTAPSSQFIYTNIPPLTLAAGSTNFLTCYDAIYFATHGTKSWSGNYINQAGDPGGAFEVAPALSYLGATTGTNLYGGTNAPSILLVGPNFQYGNLQPSRLSISLTTSNTALLSWPATDTVGQLQVTPVLGNTMTNVLIAPTVLGANKVVEWPATDSQAFFRLKYP